jgi:hypothetical protein
VSGYSSLNCPGAAAYLTTSPVVVAGGAVVVGVYDVPAPLGVLHPVAFPLIR